MDWNSARQITRRKGACLNCRLRKVRCDGSPECSQCLKSGIICAYDRTRLSAKSNGQPPTSSTLRCSPTISRSLHSNAPVDTGQVPQPWQGVAVISPLGNLDHSAFESYFDIPDIFRHGTLDASNPRNIDVETAHKPCRTYNADESWTEPPGMFLDGRPSCEIMSRTESNHCLGHNISIGADYDWSKMWAEDLCGDISSLSPLRFLGRYTKSVPRTQVLSLSKRIWTKARYIPKVPKPNDELDFESPLPSYAHQCTTQFVDAFFQNCHECSLFVSRRYVEDIIAEMILSSGTVDSCASALINAILAIGCRILIRKDRPYSNTVRAGSVSQPSQYFGRALRCRDELLNGQSSLLKIKTLIAMVLHIREHRNASLTRTLLSQAVYMVQELSLVFPRSASSLDERRHQDDIERLFWFLYSIEKPFALRFGGHSMVDDDLIVYDAPTKSRQSIVSNTVIVKTLYAQASLRMSPADVVASIDRLSNMLEAWRLSIPVAYRPNSPTIPDYLKRSWDSCIQSDMFLKYAEASFAIHRWAVIVEAKISPDLSASYTSSRQQCVELAKAVLCLTHSFRVDQNRLDWHHVFLPLLSTIILYVVISKQETGKDCLPYLGMACGYFGRQDMDASTSTDLFDEISELYILAHGDLGSARTRDSSPFPRSIETPKASDDLGSHQYSGPLQMDVVDPKNTFNCSVPRDSDLDFFDFPGDVADGFDDIPQLR